MKKIIISPTVKKNDYNEMIFSVESNWYSFFKDQNVNLMTLSPDLKISEKNISGIIIQGGNDLIKFSNKKQNFLRKKNDMRIIKYALKKKIPILAVCYGFQLIAQYYGSVIQKIKKHVRERHLLHFKGKNSKKIYVNSFHNYGVFNLPNFFDEVVKCEDGSIEFARSKKKNIMCMMFHPERKLSNKQFIKKMIKQHFDF